MYKNYNTLVFADWEYYSEWGVSKGTTFNNISLHTAQFLIRSPTKRYGQYLIHAIIDQGARTPLHWQSMNGRANIVHGAILSDMLYSCWRKNSFNALAHYTQNCRKSVIFHTHSKIFLQLQWFFQQLYIWTTIFTMTFLRKIFAVLCADCEGLQPAMYLGTCTLQKSV